MKDTKIKERYRRLLAMAGDANSPHEAAIAARRAAALMRKHNLKESDALEDSWSVDDLVGTFAEEPWKRVPGWIQALHIPVAQLNGCEVRNWLNKVDGDVRWTTQWLGTEADAMAAQVTLDYLMNQISNLAMTYQKGGKRTRKQMNDFRFGAAVEIARSIRAIVWNQEKAHATGTGEPGELTVVSKRQAVQLRFGVKYRGGSGRGVGSGFGHGAAAGRGVGVRESVRQGSAPLRIGGAA